MGQLHGDALEGVESVGLSQASGAAQRGAILRLEHPLDERVVAPFVVLQGLSSDHFVRPPRSLEVHTKRLLASVKY